jgi:uncharacterized membrane protein YeaQ/YmgE (transglycosylase-associated protein family)
MYLVVWTIIVGLVVGLIARSLGPKREEGDSWVKPGLGISGSLLGSIVGRALGMYGPRDPVSLVMATIGAILVILLYRRYFLPVTTATRKTRLQLLNPSQTSEDLLAPLRR